MIREFRDEWSGIWGPKHSINYGPDKHVQRGDERDIHQEPRPKRLRMKTHFLEQPAAEILQRENVTTPATNKTPEDERRQNCQAKKMKPAFTNPFCSVYIVSEGSMGETVLPINRHWMMCAIMNKFRAINAAARHRPVFDLRMPVLL